MNPIPGLANAMWIGASLPAYWRFQRALNRPEQAQRWALRDLLARNAGCEFGRLHDFGTIQTPEEFAHRVPFMDPANLEPWTDRLRSGEQGLLTTDAVTHLIPTSGSTRARKLIPFTGGLQREFDAAIGPWITDLAGQCPAVLLGPAYWSISPSLMPQEPMPSAIPVGFDDDASYLGGVRARLVRAATVRPAGFDPSAGVEDFRYRTLVALVRERNLRLISVWHPSFLSLLLDAMPQLWRRLLDAMSASRRRELACASPELPMTIWPALRVVSCWADGHASMCFGDLRPRLPGVLIQSKGLLATEAFVTIPFQGSHPVAIGSHYYEFLDEDGSIHPVHELRRGFTYEVIVSTGGGLWRYRLGDRVEVDGFVKSTPSLRFVGRAGGVSDIAGEKLSEGFVAAVLSQAFDQLGLTPRLALLAPDLRGNAWAYTLFVEPGQASESLRRFVEEGLRQNPGYAQCRRLGQLHPVRLFQIRQRGCEVFVEHESRGGSHIGDVKPKCLSWDSGWAARFDGSYAACAETDSALRALHARAAAINDGTGQGCAGASSLRSHSTSEPSNTVCSSASPR